MKCRFKSRATGMPSQVGDATFSKTRRLHPLQNVQRALAIETKKASVPDEGGGNRRNNVDEDETAHGNPMPKIVLLIDACTQANGE